METFDCDVFWFGLDAGGAGDLGFAAAGDRVRRADVFLRAGLATTAVMGVMLVVGCVACICCAPASIAAKGDEDPGEVVMDEFAAQALTFLAVPLLVPRNLCGWESLVIAAFGFLVFRVFDILKPGPIRRLERLPGGWGVLADDLVAGMASAVFVYIAMILVVRG